MEEWTIWTGSNSNNTIQWTWYSSGTSFTLIGDRSNSCEVWHDKQGNPTTNKKLRYDCPLFRNENCLLKNPKQDCILKLKNKLLFGK